MNTRTYCVAALISMGFVFFCTAPLFAQSTTIEQAQALFQAQNWPEAEKAYVALVKQDTSNGLAWFRLGYTHQGQEEFSEAIGAWQRSNQVGFAPVTSRYNIASAYARLGHTDEAFAWLEQSAQAGFNQIQQLDTDTDLDTLRHDARFAEVRNIVDRNVRPCHYDERFRQFDFWIGEWDVFNGQGQQAGTNTIERVQRGCVLQENWTGAGGSTGTSYNYYDPGDQKWKQLWLSATGNSASFAGTFRDGAMRFEGTWVNSDGTSSLMKMTFTPLDDGRVRQYFEQSTDGGQTWNPWFDGYYTRKPGTDN